MLIRIAPDTSVDVDETLLEIERCELEASLYDFTVAAWPHIDSAPFAHGGYALQAICEHLEACCDGHISNLLVNVPPRFSKPVAADTLISTRRGLIPLREVVVGDYVLTHRGRFRRVQAVHQQGVLPVLRLTTRRGRSVVAAHDHPFLTPNGWVELGQIQSDDVVGIIPQFEESGEDTITVSEAALMGYLIGDGRCHGTPNITVADDIEAADIRRVIADCGFNHLDQSYKMASNGYMLRRISIKATKPLSRTKGAIGPVRQWMEKHDLWQKSSYTKTIPQAVLRGSDAVVKAFIGAYWACDGFITTKGAKRDGTERDDLTIGCDSVHKEYMEQMQALLLRIGVESTVRKKVSKIKTKKQGDIYTSYSLTIHDQDNCWRFANQIYIPHSKNERLINARKRRFDFDKTIVGNSVNSIESCGETECICLTVDEDSSFVANGFAVHNSTICGVMFPAWVWAQRNSTPLAGPGAQFLHAGYAMPLALQDSVKCRTLIQSDWYQQRWGNRFKLVGDMNTKTRFQNDKKGIRNTVSVGGATTGLGGNYLIGDDLNNSAEANSEAIIQSTVEWWDLAWYNRLNNSKPGFGCRIVIAQRLSEQDISGHILEKGVDDWTHLCLPMRYEPDRACHTVLVPAEATEDGEPVTWTDPRTELGELLWPERFDERQVSLLERTLGPWASAGQLQQRPEPAGGGIIKRDWWQLWPHEAFPPFEFIVASLDTAYGLKEENDYSALTVWGIFYGSNETRATRNVDRYGRGRYQDAMSNTDVDGLPRIMLMTAFQDRLELHDLVRKVGDICRRMKVDKLLIENKASGISVSQEIRRIYGHEEWAVQLVDPKGQDKLARLYSVQHLFAEGMVHAPDRSWADTVITQASQFPKGKHDDLVDSLSQALRHLRELGLLTRSEERMAEIDQSMRHESKTIQPLYPA